MTNKRMKPKNTDAESVKLNTLLDVLATIEIANQNVAKEQDKLRKIYDELETLLENNEYRT